MSDIPAKIAELRGLLELPITAVIKSGKRHPIYWLVTDEESYRIGGIAELSSYAKFRNAIASSTGGVIGRREWQRAAPLLIACAAPTVDAHSHIATHSHGA